MRAGGSIVVSDIEKYLSVVEYPGTKYYSQKALLCNNLLPILLVLQDDH